MALIMGIDTGGTYTDGVLLDYHAKKVVCKSKVFTQRHNLSTGIGKCIENLMNSEPGKVSMVCLSTTLATNAIVEGRRGKTGLLLAGGMPEGVLPADIIIELQGKMNIKGTETQSISRDEVIAAGKRLKERVDAVAVSGYASVRNPVHELQVKAMIREELDLPVICAHELTSELGFYERTVTAVLNAGLIPVIGDLVRSVKMVLKEKNMDVPVMIVKGDGSLMRESCAMEKPIETILSGPAASVAGAVYLTNQMYALVLDMGGTTTDTALISNGRVSVKNSGANVGGWKPQIRAADLRTFGIGGDSLISVSSDGGLMIGPEKVQPLCTVGNRYPNLLPELQGIRSDQCSAGLLADCYAVAQRPGSEKLNNTEKKVLDFLGNEAHSLIRISEAFGKYPDELDLKRMVKHNILLKISLTPTDILHVQGVYREWDDTISKVAAEILAAKMGMGLTGFTDAVVRYMTSRLLEACRESLSDFGKKMTGESADPCRPGRMIAIGAPVKAWIPPVSHALHSTLIIPEHAEVANAVGAAAGQIVETAEVLVRPDKETDDFILHAPWECRHFKAYAEAVEYAVTAARNFVYQRADTAGANRIEVTDSREDIYVESFFDTPKALIETRIRAAAVGNPEWNPF